MSHQNTKCRVTVAPSKINQKCNKLKVADYTSCGRVRGQSQTELNYF